jgi:hypothetical protein
MVTNYHDIRLLSFTFVTILFQCLKGDKARIVRAVRLIRRGAISRAGKALESKGLGDV